MDTDQILKDLKSSGHKMTPVRTALIEVLLGSDTPLSIEEISNLLESKDLTPNKTTLYREVEFLKEQKMLEEIDFGDGKKRYEISSTHHHHIVCVTCKTVVDIPMEEDLDSKEKQILLKFKFKPIGHSLEFFGLCQNCQ